MNSSKSVPVLHNAQSTNLYPCSNRCQFTQWSRFRFGKIYTSHSTNRASTPVLSSNLIHVRRTLDLINFLRNHYDCCTSSRSSSSARPRTRQAGLIISRFNDKPKLLARFTRGTVAPPPILSSQITYRTRWSNFWFCRPAVQTSSRWTISLAGQFYAPLNECIKMTTAYGNGGPFVCALEPFYPLSPGVVNCNCTIYDPYSRSLYIVQSVEAKFFPVLVICSFHPSVNPSDDCW